MTQRSPVYVRISPREWPRELLTWIDGGPQLGSQPTPFIPRQSEWPNPVLARANLELRTWSNSLPPGVVGNPVPPILNRDWPNPSLRVQNHELRTWLHAQQLTPPTVLPFGQTDWPNPRAQARNQDLLSWVEGLPQTALALTVPRRQLDWPNPVLARANLELRTWVEGLPQTALALTLPLRQTEWPNPGLARPSFDLRTWVAGPQLTTTVALPFNQFNWPNPPAQRVNLDLRTWTEGLSQTSLALTVPPGQRDWPLPPQARPNLALRGWSFSLQIQPQVVLPFNQFEWPNPAPKPLNFELRSWRQGVPQSVLANQLPPIRSIDWMNPASSLLARRRASTLSEVTQARATPTLGTGVAPILEVVPYLIEDVLSAALARIASIYCVANVIGTTGSVTIQDPLAFTLVARGSTITITLGGTIKGSGTRKAQAPYGSPDAMPPFPDPKLQRH